MTKIHRLHGGFPVNRVLFAQSSQKLTCDRGRTLETCCLNFEKIKQRTSPGPGGKELNVPVGPGSLSLCRIGLVGPLHLTAAASIQQGQWRLINTNSCHRKSPTYFGVIIFFLSPLLFKKKLITGKLDY